MVKCAPAGSDVLFRRLSELDALQVDTEKAHVALSGSVRKLERQISTRKKTIEEYQDLIAHDNARFEVIKAQLAGETRKLLQAEEEVAELERKAYLAEMDRRAGALVRLSDLGCRTLSDDRRRTLPQQSRW